ncbi:carbamoyltransferase HypF [Cohnella sp. WQ 127256]|uniref:carbamoyltransferase HypF n=1 Tax=Cohnella sp. WQ 127256 TaxID=2938790 RepID=UPI0021183846|nr:carbamoyltransferase HypF [Cohnella sp. WQ 127256]
MDRQRLSGHEGSVIIVVKGRVQGVGFRPFLYLLAEEYQIRGGVRNSQDGVEVMAEGSASNLDQFIEAIQNRSPGLARVDELKVTEVPSVGYETFMILSSDSIRATSLSISPDIAVCEHCLREMRNPSSRFYRYPFINCTQCGPRYSIIRDLPYDRSSTSMSTFEWCDDCRIDYGDVRNRRFHAQPIACAKCGPKLKLIDGSGNELACQNDAIALAKKRLKEGAIVAVKGIGGYHLACDALSSSAVGRIRLRKRRLNRPLAVMASSVTICELIGDLSDKEKELLTSSQRPIVVTRFSNQLLLPEEIAPNMRSIGLMLPYTPLHYMLLEDEDLPFLIMTSANSSGFPILYKDEEALTFLSTVADYVLTHDREIVHPIEDTVVQWKGNKLDFLRRGRGFVPDPIEAMAELEGIVALGGQQKSVMAMGRGKGIIVGPPNGDLGSLEMETHGQEQYRQLSGLLSVTADTIAADMHPRYSSRALVSDSYRTAEYVSVQHHHAHHVSCMTDNGLNESCYGLILDGTGYGLDGCIWGFELLYGDGSGFERLGHLRYTPLPGGEASVKQPWRNAAAMVMALLPRSGVSKVFNRYPNYRYEIGLIRAMMKKKVNAPMAGTCGRLFDAVSSLLGICDVSTYEGEAAILLSELVSFYEGKAPRPYPYSIRNAGSLQEINFSRMFKEMLSNIERGISVEAIALRFHETVADAAVRLLIYAHRENPERRKEVVLSGGSFHNRRLSDRIRSKLEDAGFKAFFHERVPCDDGGLALGQLIVASKASARKKK